MDVVIVGAGLGGLACACRLAGSGHNVLVLERGSRPGGRAGRAETNGFTFDTGPTVLTMPDLIEETFQAAGSRTADHIDLVQLDPAYRATFHDGSVIKVRAGVEAMADEIAQFSDRQEALAWRKFCRWLEELYDLEKPAYIDRNFDHSWDMLTQVRTGMQVIRSGGFRSYDAVVKSFFRDWRLRRLFTFQALYAGLSPFRARALYSVITYCDTVRGVYFPRGGIHELPVGLANAATDAGASIRYQAPVDRVLRSRDGSVEGVRLADGERIGADAVVVNAELSSAYRELLPGLPAPRRLARARYSPSFLVWNAGVRGQLPADTAHHNIYFGHAWRSAFRDLSRGEAMHDPSFFVTAASLTDPSLAPAGQSTLFGLVPVPNLHGKVDWDRRGDELKAGLKARIAAAGYPDEVLVEHWSDPTDWLKLGMEGGTPLSLAHLFSQTGSFRPANFDRRAPGLVFVGCGTNPGVGIPMVLISARLAAERIEGMDRSRNRRQWSSALRPSALDRNGQQPAEPLKLAQ